MKRKKLRGSSTAGKGAGDRSRSGAGRRGGRGRAGGGKRGQQKLMTFFTNKIGKQPAKSKKIPLNLNRIQNYLDDWKAKNLVAFDGDKIILHLDDLGFSKVCGRFGTNKYKLIIYGNASRKAKEEITANGGEVKYE